VKYAAALSIALGMLGVPGLVHADALRVTSYDMDDAGGTLRLESDAPIGEPWLRIDGKVVRIWFPHVVDVARFENERNADDPIHSLSLRPGASDTAVVRVELGSARRIGRDDIEVVRNGAKAAIALRVQTPGKKNAEPVAAAAKNARPVQQLTAAEPEPAKPAPVATPQPAPEPAAQPVFASKPAAPLDLSTPKTDPAAGHSFMLLGAATFILGAVYLGLQLYNKRRPQLQKKPGIEVLGVRRLGHRQELLIVRALGQDHLILCTAGRAERVASTPTPFALPGGGEPEPAPALRAPGADTQAGGIGLISRLSSQHRLRKLLDSVERETEAPEREREREHTGTFGAELMTAHRRGSRRPSLHSLPGPAAAGRQSDAVAGITRLRRRATS
jgi:hypothetical protein